MTSSNIMLPLSNSFILPVVVINLLTVLPACAQLLQQENEPSKTNGDSYTTVDGSYKTIDEGYLLVFVQQNEQHLFVNISLATNSSHTHEITEPASSASALTFHHRRRQIIWVDHEKENAHIASLDSEEFHEMFKQQNGAAGANDTCRRVPTACTVDWVHENVYWLAYGYEKGPMYLMMTKYSQMATRPNYVKTWKPFAPFPSIPQSVALDAKNASLFWAEFNSVSGEGRIVLASLDLSNQWVIAKRNVIWPRSLTVDQMGGKVYWADVLSFTISSCDYSGHNRIDRPYKGLEYYPYSIAVFHGYVYWSDHKNKSILRMSIDQPDNTAFIRQFSTDEQQHSKPPQAIIVYHSDNQPAAKNHCAVAECSHFCTAVPNIHGNELLKSVCLCPDMMRLSGDGKRCDALGSNDGNGTQTDQEIQEAGLLEYFAYFGGVLSLVIILALLGFSCTNPLPVSI